MKKMWVLKTDLYQEQFLKIFEDDLDLMESQNPPPHLEGCGMGFNLFVDWYKSNSAIAVRLSYINGECCDYVKMQFMLFNGESIKSWASYLTIFHYLKHTNF